MKYIGVGLVVLALAGEAGATTTTFSGTAGADTITVGRGYNGGGALVYLACVNGSWAFGSAVTGSSDYVYVYGYGGADTITIRSTNDIFTCGAEARWLFRMDFTYACPNIYVYGGTGNDVLNGAQCAENVYGEAGADTIFPAGGNDAVWGGTENDCVQDTTLGWLSCGDGTDLFTDDDSWKDCERLTSYCFLPP